MFLHKCSVCNSFYNGSGFLCPNCLNISELEKFDSFLVRCNNCFRPQISQMYLCACKNEKDTLKIYSIYDYRAPFFRRILERWKFKGERHLSSLISFEYYKALNTLNLSSDNIILQAVPCSKEGKKKRKFDQMSDVVSYLNRKYGYKKCQLLKKTKIQTEQQKKMNKEMREKYAYLKFQYKNNKKNEALKKYQVVLLDDITTTGSTLRACKKILSENGHNVSFSITLLAEL